MKTRWLITPVVLLSILVVLILNACNTQPTNPPPPPSDMQVTISAPSVDAFTNGNQTVQVVVENGTPDGVTLYKDGKPLASLTPPYSFSWDTRTEPEGTYTMMARAVKGGKSVDSTPRRITVDRSIPTITSRTPAPNARNVSVRDPIQIVFSEPIAPTTVNESTVRLFESRKENSASGMATSETGTLRTEDVEYTTKLSDDGKTLSIQITKLSGPTGFRLWLNLSDAAALETANNVSNNSITDRAGNTLAPTYWEWSAPDYLEVNTNTPNPAPLDVDAKKSTTLPSMMLDQQDYPVVSWLEQTKDSHELHVKRWNGTQWVRLGEALQTESSLIYHQDLVLDTNGNPFVIWSESPTAREAPAQIRVKHWNGIAWESLGKTLNKDAKWAAFGPSITVDKQGNPIAAWTEADGTSLNLWVKRWNGTAWELAGKNQPLDVTKDNYAFLPSIAADAMGTVYVAWTETNTFVKKLVGELWEQVGAKTLSVDPNRFSMGASLAMDRSGLPVVSWSERKDFSTLSPSTVFVKRFDGLVWNEVGRVEGGDFSAPSLDIHPHNHPVVSVLGYNQKPILGWAFTQRFLTGSNVYYGILRAEGNTDPDAVPASLKLDRAGNPVIAVTHAVDVKSGNRDLRVWRWNGLATLQADPPSSGK